MAGDGQVTYGQTVEKQGARKIRRLFDDRVLHSRYLRDSRPSSNSTAATSNVLQLNLPKTGARIACCADLRRCWSLRTRIRRSSFRAPAI